MNLISLQFFGFVGLVLVVYYLLPRRAQNYWLLAMSYGFYLTWSWQFPLILAGMTGWTFFLAQKLQADQSRRRVWLYLGIGGNLGVLLLFKYADFFVPQMASLISRLGMNVKGIQILLPIGMSFYILQAISYLLDVSRKQIPAATHIGDFALYLAYFPKLTAGPIERARTFLPQLAQHRVVDNEALARSFTLITIGLVRKIVVADMLLKAIPSKIFVTPEQFSALELFIWLATYFFGLYHDFAGYTNLMRGVSGLFGIELSRNFAHPLFARNFTEFWSRWHITLSQWLRDYIYFPLSRVLVRRNLSRFNLADLILPPVATMLVSGLWHGNQGHILLWGLLMGIYLVGERLPSLWLPVTSPSTRPRWRQGGGMVIVFLLILGSLPLVLTNISTAINFWQRLLHWNTLAWPNVRILLVLVPGIWLDWVQYRNKNELIFLTWPRTVQASLLALAALAVLLFSRVGPGEPFIYQGF
ncbi:hypothetical protein GF339_12715 [candidate division KSB3 bacterium]|uniref:Membrane-bound O-acyltransferase family protein n=1 Tax=candidate division KSB3 bacterium TaxID=2044937 RepID=A0A9D5JWK2_9BACT|nr:hypothetical protein [candidate division KSB3 bacterium]MBD3325445.1 hypothetical protein [candidate division KSB3 bacterium]